jgi:hypothetical protein
MTYTFEKLTFSANSEWKWCIITTHRTWIMACLKFLNSGGTNRIRKLVKK